MTKIFTPLKAAALATLLAAAPAFASDEVIAESGLTLAQEKQMAQDVLTLAFSSELTLEEKTARLPEIINKDKYIQHNPMADDGLDSLLGFIAYVDAEFGAVELSIKRVIGEGNLVAVHSHYKFGPKDERGNAIVDIFRFEDGHIVEHWDVIQPIPAESQNPNTMF